MGYCLLVAGAIFRFANFVNIHGFTRLLGRKIIPALFILYVAALGAKTVLRNEQWQTDYSIHEADSQSNAFNVKLVTNFGLLQHEVRLTGQEET
jgi:hypothetical protein